MSKKNNITAIVCTYNEEANIEDCLKSLLFADEIVVVDEYSTDDTVEIAKKFTDKIYSHKSQGYVEPARNFAISKASNEWIILLDADERIGPELKDRLITFSKEDAGFSAVEIPRRNIIFGKWIRHSGWYPDYQIRFFKKQSVQWSDLIHSKPEIKGATIKLEELENLSIEHQNYQSVEQFLKKMNIYTSVEAAEFIASGSKFYWIDIIRKPFSEFLSRFFARAGYRDGLHGLVLALLQSVSALFVILKIWEKKGFEPVDEKIILQSTESQIKQMKKDLMFWLTNEKISNTKNPVKKNIYKVIRKLSH